VFLPAWGKKHHCKRVQESKTADILSRITGNQVWHVSCVCSVHAGFFQSTLDLLRGIWQSARGGITADPIDFQLACQ